MARIPHWHHTPPSPRSGVIIVIGPGVVTQGSGPPIGLQPHSPGEGDTGTGCHWTIKTLRADWRGRGIIYTEAWQTSGERTKRGEDDEEEDDWQIGWWPALRTRQMAWHTPRRVMTNLFGEIFRWARTRLYFLLPLSAFLCPTSSAFLAGPRPLLQPGWVPATHCSTAGCTGWSEHAAVLQAVAGAEPSSGNRELSSPLDSLANINTWSHDRLITHQTHNNQHTQNVTVSLIESILYSVFDKIFSRKSGRWFRVNLIILMIMMTVMTRMIMIFPWPWAGAGQLCHM